MSTRRIPSLGGRIHGAAATHLAPRARLLALLGSLLVVASAFMPWVFEFPILGDLRYWGEPAPLQLAFLCLAAMSLILLLITSPWGKHLGRGFNEGAGIRAVGIALAGGSLLVILAIGVTTGALANMEPGVIVCLVGSLLVLVAGLVYPVGVRGPEDVFPTLPRWVEALLLVSIVGLGLLVTTVLLQESDPWTFGLLVGCAIAVAVVVARSDIGTWLGLLTKHQRRPLLLAVFVAALALPFTQGGKDEYMSIAVQVLIFAATAVGLNIVVGLAGLLDLGYIAFLGAGAYVAATMSHSAFATINVKPPFIVIMLIAMAVSATLGLIIGSPTLRVSGDYLAIVTLAFGEIFRLCMLNLDGSGGGRNLTGGPNGIQAIPGLGVFGFKFDDTHHLLGIPLTRFSNYYFLLLLITIIIIVVFTRLNNSRIGRGWVAIREDEKAAEAMGVNVFGLKILAFAGGAALAGLAGTVKAHVDISVTPDQYLFLESAFLLAAVVLGGMGTVTGVLVGAMLLKLLPEKLRFFSDYRLLMFGVLLVVMMRFRPEGLIQTERDHPADDYPDAVAEGRARPIDGTLFEGGKP